MPRHPWLALFVVTRAVAVAVAAALLVARPLHDGDELLLAVGVTYGTVSVAAAWGSDAVRRSPVAWLVDAASTLGLILASDQWRSPFFLMAVTALVFPATTLAFGRALAAGAAFTGVYLTIAFSTGAHPSGLDDPIRTETLATHLLMPMLVVLALAYAAQLLGRLRGEQSRAERLAVEAERRRIAWELHDSSKQRVHAAHLVLSSLFERLDGDDAEDVGLAVTELAGALADMEASLSELRAPIAAESLGDQLRARAKQLSRATPATILVEGDAPGLPGWMAHHTYRIAAEALTNAARHAHATRIDVRLSCARDRLAVVVSDDGQGLPIGSADGGHGLTFMHGRAEALHGRLRIDSGPGGRGTIVGLEIPLTTQGAPT